MKSLAAAAHACAAWVALVALLNGAVTRCEAVSLRAESKASTSRFDFLRYSAVRIQAVSAQFNWFQPFGVHSDGVGLGSGWLVQTEPYPLFVTNQHVINDAKQVTLQLIVFGEQQWHAEVVTACPEFDLALLVLKDNDGFKAAMKERGIAIKPLELAEYVPSMGDDVVALGFPLGQDSLKISKGNIAGNQEVNGNVCIQSTAPISPGSSGGPLLNEDASQVVGVNFAKATQGENINYVIPVWRVRQLVQKHLKDQPEMPQDGLWKRIHVQVPRPDITTIEANEALYAMAGGCKKGIYITRIAERSFLQKAEPPVASGSFLVSVSGRELDGFGEGINTDYVADRVYFPDLFFMVEDLSADAEFETCVDGKVTKHKVSMEWSPEYERGLRYVHEPSVEGKDSSYELFGDISVMEMTVNHISTVVANGDPGPARWLHPDSVAQPRLIVNYVRSGSYAADVLKPGQAVTKVNGQPVKTLAEFKKNFVPKNASNIWTLETDMGQMVATIFKKSLGEQITHGASSPYLMTPSVVSAAQQLGFLAHEEKEKDKAVGNATQPETMEKTALLSKVASVADAQDDVVVGVKAAGPVEVSMLASSRRSVAVTAQGKAIYGLGA